MMEFARVLGGMAREGWRPERTSMFASWDDYTAEEFDRVIPVNLRGTFNVLREAGRIMSERGGGSIIAFSSIRSLVVEPGQGVYAATKAGIVQLGRTLAAELGPKNVRVNAIAPGVVDTPLTRPIKDQPD